MEPAQNPELADAIEGALQWWREAGVDIAYLDEPVDWLARKSRRQEEPATREPAADGRQPGRTARMETVRPSPPRPDTAGLPSSLPDFGEWWLAEPSLVDGPVTGRVAPRGPGQAELMVIVPEPEREDRDKLLSGAQGRLLDAMIAAFAVDPAQVYLASALPRHLPGADWDALAAAGLGGVLERHVSLVAPRRIAVFGTSVLPLISHKPPQGPADLRIFNHEGTSVPMLACRSLAALLEQPRWKAGVWRAWLELTG